MKIAVVANSAWYLKNFRLTLMRVLAAQGHDVIGISAPGEDARRIEVAGFPHHAIALSGKGVNPLRELRSVLALRRLLARERVRLALSYTPKANLYTGLARRGLRCRQIANISGLGSSFLRGGWVGRLMHLLYRSVLPGVDRVFFQNASDARHFFDAGLTDPARCEVLPGSGVDLQRFTPAPQPARPNEAMHFLMVARLIADKGVREYVAAARGLKLRWPQLRFQLLGAVGADNPTAIDAAELQSWIEDGTIEYLGFRDDVRDALAQADCVVLPSYREGMSRTLLEAAALQRPLIATRVPGCVEVIDDARNGYLCEPRDASSLEQALRRIVELPLARRLEMGRHSRAIVERQFSEQIVIDRYLAAVSRLRPQ